MLAGHAGNFQLISNSCLVWSVLDCLLIMSCHLVFCWLAHFFKKDFLFDLVKSDLLTAVNNFIKLNFFSWFVQQSVQGFLINFRERFFWDLLLMTSVISSNILAIILLLISLALILSSIILLLLSLLVGCHFLEVQIHINSWHNWNPVFWLLSVLWHRPLDHNCLISS